MNNKRTSAKTLLLSVLMSAPGPLILGLGLMAGRSSTQIADFVRRSAELLGIIMAYVTYVMTTRNGGCDEEKKERLEMLSNVFVGAMMCLGGALMLLLAFISGNEAKGSVVTGLIVALLGVIANTLFWIKYSRLNRVEPNAIIAVQARLYRAKSFVDGCVSAALLSVMLLPASKLSYYLDFVGSVIVSIYLLWCGIKTIMERVNEKHN